MHLSQVFSAIRTTISKEADRGYHVMSITLSRKFSAWPTEGNFDCPIYYSSGLSPSEFILSLRSSPSDLHVNFYKVHHDIDS